MYDDETPLLDYPDPFTARFTVKPIVVLEPESAIPIHEDEVWNNLSITNQYEKGHPYWTGFFRGSLNVFNETDGIYLKNLLKQQAIAPGSYPLTEKDNRQLAGKTVVRTLDREVEVEIPDEFDRSTEFESTLDDSSPATVGRESTRMQAKVAQMGAEMGFHIWVPRNDKARVLEHNPERSHGNFYP